MFSAEELYANVSRQKMLCCRLTLGKNQPGFSLHGHVPDAAGVSFGQKRLVY